MKRTVTVKFKGLTLICTGYYTPYQRETGPTYACGGTPPEPAEFSFDTIETEQGEDVYSLIDDAFMREVRHNENGTQPMTYTPYMVDLETAVLERIEEVDRQED